jgi:hypothetical protein
MGAEKALDKFDTSVFEELSFFFFLQKKIDFFISFQSLSKP